MSGLSLALGDLGHVRIYSALRVVLFHTNLSISPLCLLHTLTHTLAKSHISVKVPQRHALKCSTFVLWCTHLDKVVLPLPEVMIFLFVGLF